MLSRKRWNDQAYISLCIDLRTVETGNCVA